VAAAQRRIIGVDFSGARDAGRKVWLAIGTVAGARLHGERWLPASERPGGAVARDGAYAALRQALLEHAPCAVGLDFPDGLPEPLIEPVPWRRFLVGFPVRYPDERAFRAACLAAAGGRELKRLTDRAARTPFCPYNLRMYRQTYYGVRDVLRPRVLSGAAVGLPMQPARADRPVWLLEACPAALLKARGLYRPYKGRGPAQRAMRRQLVAHLTDAAGVVVTARGLARRLIADTDGDAIDAVLAAVAAWRAVSHGPLRPPDWRRYVREGYVYCG